MLKMRKGQQLFISKHNLQSKPSIVIQTVFSWAEYLLFRELWCLIVLPLIWSDLNGRWLKEILGSESISSNIIPATEGWLLGCGLIE